MYKVMDLNLSSGQWVDRGAVATLAEGKQKLAASNSFVFWDGPLPASLTDQQRLFSEIFAANDGRVERVTVGLELPAAQKSNPSLSSCPGNCFCVVTSGSRRCETYYCSGGLCWWVPCGMGC